MYKILYLAPGPMPPCSDSAKNKFSFLSSISKGDILQPTWWENSQSVNLELGENSYPEFNVKSFTYHFLLNSPNKSKIVSSIRKFYFYLSSSRKLVKNKGKYDFIISYGANTTGLSALIIKLIFGGKLIIEIPGVPEKGSIYDSPKKSLIKKINLTLTNLILRIISVGTDHFKLLYPEQLSYYKFESKSRSSIFHDFVPTKIISKLKTSDQKFILFIGSPWYLKGVDILIESFHQIKSSFPDHQLKIIGWFPDKAKLIELRNNEERIEIFGPEKSNIIYDQISKCSMLILPSRMEAMGRVLLEAMSLEKPIIGSNVNGIPHYIQDGFNGLTFKSEDSYDLSKKIELLLKNPELASTLGRNGRKLVDERFNEKHYVNQYKRMLDKLTKG